MSKYSRAFKLIIAKQCLDGMSSIQLAQKHSTPSRQIRYWTQVFSIHGTDSFLPTAHSKSVSTKLQALTLMWTNKWSLGHTSAVLNFSSPGTLSVWLKRYYEQGISGLEDHCIGRPLMTPLSKTTPKPDAELPLEELREELAYLRAENDVLKKFEELEQKKRKQTQKKR
jgi:transposase